ncbi:hypothetical protein [Shewanella violacea]|uniref:Lipoprotein, putative n=1 Tax=Shewanella violacea (strain JCM 10179 / CIP 106290 / LMG 19151 / DSS12) TaxID=637905 RepID=D4ZJ86_SHEVD|nr:hypothetical protein [Shewanella violacea]BAJ01735.1 lipoprotein, putative [Shewanella violacea DSS12]
MQKYLIKTLSSLFILIVFAGCADKKMLPSDFQAKVKDKFHTDIRSNGTKLFTYKAKLASLSDSSNPRPNQQSRSLGSRTERYEVDLTDWTLQIELGLSKTLDMTGYCREGYMELSRLIESDRGEIRGECNEGATQADRKKFST